MRQTLTKIKNVISGERIFYRVREISNFHRIQASTGYRAAAQHVRGRLEEDGLAVKIRTYPADGKTWFYTSKMFQEWDCKEAYLNLVDPEIRLADFKTDNLSVIQKSYPCDYRDQPLEIVLLDKGSDPQSYAGLDLRGKLVFVREHFQDFLEWAVKEGGAVGFITDYMRELKDVRARYDLYDIYNYTSFWWKHTEDEPHPFGFVLTPRQGDQLAKICRDKQEEHAQDPAKEAYPKATCYMDSRLYDGEIEVVETLIPGETEEEVLIVAHLCHPRSSANDNASGVAASMEAARVLHELIDRGELPPLKRGIRMIFMPEFTGTFPYLYDLGDHIQRIKGGINLDMVGARQAHGYGPITISEIPRANPSFCVNLAALVLDEVKKNIPSQPPDTSITMFNSAIASFQGGSDHFILSDPTINIPTFMLGQWPDLTYHTSGDTIEVIDPFILHKSASICAGYVYLLANLGEEDVPLILNKSRERFVSELTQSIQAAAEQALSPKQLYERFQHETGYYQACNAALLGFFGEPAGSRIGTRVEKENILLDELASTLWDGYLEAYAPGFVYEADPVPDEYRYIPVRQYIAPLVHLEDYALGDAQKMADYKRLVKNYHKALQSAHTFDAIVQYNMDGKRSLWEIARAAMLEAGEGSVEYVHQFVQLLKSFGLVEVRDN